MDTQNILKLTKKFIQEANSSNKTNDKINVIKKYPQLKKLFQYINDKQKTFGITSKNYKKYIKSGKNKNFINYKNLFTLLDNLYERKITGDSALSSLKNFISQYINYEDVILRIIDKNLKTRTNTKIINKAFPGLIKIFEVQLAEKYKEKKIKKGSRYYISRKLDGVRCICYYQDSGKKITFYSRAGNKFVDKDGKCTLTKLYKPLKEVFGYADNLVLDGEICVNNNGVEDFQKVVSEIRKHIEHPKFYIFDILNKEDFEKGFNKIPFKRRYEKLIIYKNIHPEINILEQVEMNDENFTTMKEKFIKNKWEGLMIKRNVCYKSGRSFDLMKYKQFFDDEFKVLDIITGPIRITSVKTGLEETIISMTAVIIDFYNTKVGSGFTIEERNKYYKNPEKIIGKMITVQYFEKTKNKDNDNLSLRFPTHKGIRDYE